MESRRWIIMRISRRTVAAAAAVLTGLASLGTAGAAFASPSTRRANGGEDVGHGRVGNGEDHDLAGDRLAAVGVADQLGGVAALGDDAGDGLAHVAGADDSDVCHGDAPFRRG